MIKREIKLSLLTDENGLAGRECPECSGYYKVKFGTGLPTTKQICPYCSHKGEGDTFYTKEQIQYIQSYIAKQVIEPELNKLGRTIKKLEQSTANSLIKIKVTTTNLNIPIKHYQEKILETDVLCDNCQLQFSIYGVFSNCPDCGKLNSLTIFKKSIETCKKKLELSLDKELTKEMRDGLQEDALSGAVSAFDSFGKSLRKKYPSKFSKRPKNLFQNLLQLEKSINKSFLVSVTELISLDEWKILVKMFQVRHLYEHNAGVIDGDFTKKIPSYDHLVGRKYKLEIEEIKIFFDNISSFAQKIYDKVE